MTFSTFSNDFLSGFLKMGGVMGARDVFFNGDEGGAG